MSVSGKTAAPYEIPYFIDGDKPPDMATVTKAMADRLQEVFASKADASLIDAEESRTNTAYGMLPTEDKATVILANPGILKVGFQTVIKSSVAEAGWVALFLNGTLLEELDVATGAKTGAAVSFGVIRTSANGLLSKFQLGSAATNKATATVELMSTHEFHWWTVRVPAGEYTVTARYKASSGSVTAKYRSLYLLGQEFTA